MLIHKTPKRHALLKISQKYKRVTLYSRHVIRCSQQNPSPLLVIHTGMGLMSKPLDGPPYRCPKKVYIRA